MFIKQAIQLRLRKTLVKNFWKTFQLSKIPSLFLEDFILQGFHSLLYTALNAVQDCWSMPSPCPHSHIYSTNKQKSFSEM